MNKRMHCPICGEEKEFIRVVEAHIKQELPTSRIPIGVPFQSWVGTTTLPVAFCPDCKIVLYIGPSPEEVVKEFEEKRKVEERFEQRNKRWSEYLDLIEEKKD